MHVPRAIALLLLRRFLLLCWALGSSPATGQGPLPEATGAGAPVWGAGQLVEYVPGTAPIVISAPHGGHLEPSAIPSRSYGTTVQDRFTQEMARALSAEITARTGRRPHLVISHLHRRKLDPNRDVVEGAQGQPQAVQAWHDYHGFIDQAKATVTAQWGRGLYFDVHGHGHPEGWVELGYGLSASELALPDPVLAQPIYVQRSTLRALASRPGVSFAEALRGATSLGGALQAAGYRAVPSPADPDPAGGNYFSGGYSVLRHGSQASGSIDGVQAELPFAARRTEAVRAAYAAVQAQAIVDFLVRHQALDAGREPVVTVRTIDPLATETGSTARFVFERRGAVSSPLTVPLAWSGSAVLGVDVETVPLQIVFAPGQARVELVVTPRDDAMPEGDEFLEVALRGGIELGAGDRAVCVVIDDERAPDALVRLECDEGTGTLARDATGNGRHGTLAAGASWLTGGAPAPPGAPSSGAIALDGVDDHLVLADLAYGTTVSGAHLRGFTWAIWFRAAPTGGTRALLGHGLPGAPQSLTVSFSSQPARLRTDLVYANDESEAEVLDIERELRDGAWHHYAVTSGPGRLSRVYLDGREVAVAFHRGDVLDPVGPVIVGGRGDLAAGSFFAGSVDGIGLWDRPLDGVEIAALYTGGWPAAAVHPGSGEDLDAAGAVGAAPRLGPLCDTVVAAPLDTLELALWSPGGTHLGRFAAWVAEVVPPGPLATHPIHPALWLPGQASVVLAGPVLLPAGGGLLWNWVVPPGFGPARAIAQGLALDPNAANGAFAASNGVELRFR